MRVGSGIKFALVLLLTLSFVFAPGLVPVPLDVPLGNQGITVASAVGGYSSIYTVRNVSGQSASYLHDFVTSGGTHKYYSPSDISANTTRTYFVRDLSDSVLPSGLYTLTVNSDQELAATFIGNESTAGPTTGIATPTGDSSAVGVPITFTAYYMDGMNTTSSTGQRLTAVYLVIGSGTSGAALTNAMYLKYDPVSNKVYLRNNANTAWLGGYAPGASNVIENNQGAVYVSNTARTWSSNKRLLTMEWSVTFRSSYAGEMSIYTRAEESSTVSSGWSNKGAWEVSPLAVTTVGVWPNSGTSGVGDSRAFTTLYQDTNAGGAADIDTAELKISSETSSFSGKYDQAENAVYMDDDSGNAIGGYAPGSINTIANSSFSLNLANTSVISAGNYLTITWAVMPLGPTIGDSFSLKLRDRSLSGEDGGWSSSYGTWDVTYRAVPVTATQESSTSSLNRTHLVTTVYTDTTSTDNIARAYFMASPSTGSLGVNAFYAYFDQPGNTFYLRNAANTTWLPATVGVTNTVENGYFRLLVDSTSVMTDGNVLAINWAIRPIGTSNGKTYNFRLGVTDDNENNTGMRSGFGSWTVLNDQAPTTVSVDPSSGSSDIGAVRTFTTVFDDADGVDDITNAQFQLRPTGAMSTTLKYDQLANLLYLRSGTGAWSSGYEPGSTNTITNADFSVAVENTSVISAENTLTVTWSISSLSGAAGKVYSLYLYDQDATGLASGWGSSYGTWYVNYRAVPVSVTPTSGTSSINHERTLTAVYSGTLGLGGDAARAAGHKRTGPAVAGTDQIGRAYLRVSQGNVNTNAFYAYYEPSSETFYLRTADDSDWLSAVRGETDSLSNGYFTLNVAQTGVQDDGDFQTIDWVIEPGSLAAGKTYNLYLSAADTEGNQTPWGSSQGSWIVAANQSPSNIDVQPDGGSSDVGTTRFFTSSYSDPDGAVDIANVYLQMRSGSTTYASFRYNQPTNQLYVLNMRRTAWIAGSEPGSDDTIDNDYLGLDLASTSVVSAGNYLTVTWAVQPLAPAVNRAYTLHLYAQDIGGRDTGWSTSQGSWYVNYRAVPVSLDPTSAGVSIYQPGTITSVYSATTTSDDIQNAFLRVSAGNVFTNAFYAYYNQPTDTFYLRDAGNAAWLAATVGVTDTVGNGYFNLHVDASSVVTADNFMTVTWSIEPLGPTAGRTYATYLAASDADGTTTSLGSPRGTWAVEPNQVPTNVGVQPDSGSSDIGATRYFTSTYGDADGAVDITNVYLALKVGSTYYASFRYNQPTNQLYVLNMRRTAWLAGNEPGSDDTIDNGYFGLDLANTEVVSAGNYLTVTWAVRPLTPAVNKTYTLHLSAQDIPGGSAGWSASQGTWYVNYRALPVSVTPTSGSSSMGHLRTMTAVYSDTIGAADIGKAYLRVSPYPYYGLTYSFYAYYDQPSNTFALRNTANSAWLLATVGLTDTVSNGYFRLHVDSTTIISDENSLTIGWSIEPLSPASYGSYRDHRLYMMAADVDGTTTAWTASQGTWRVVRNLPPATIDVQPDSGSSDSGVARTFTTVFSDPDGADEIRYADFEITNYSTPALPVGATASFWGRYDRANNLLSLRNTPNSAWSPGYEPGSSNTIANTYFSLDVASTEVVSAGNVLTVTWSVTPLSPAVNKTYRLYLADQDTAGARSNWSASMGTWYVNYRAVPVSLTPTSGGSTIYDYRSITAVYSDTTTSVDIGKAYLRVSPPPAPYSSLVNAFQAYYDQSSASFYLRNAANTAWISGTAGVIDNGYFNLDIDATTVVAAGDFMTVTWAVAPQAPTANKTYGLFLAAADADNTATAWGSARGTWTIAANSGPRTMSLSPSSGTTDVGLNREFTAVYSDTNGFYDIKNAYIELTDYTSPTPPSTGRTLYGWYDQVNNRLWIRNDANTAWLGGFAPGASNTVANNDFSVDIANTTVISADNVLTVTWSVEPLAVAVNRSYNLYLSAQDRSGATASWLKYGTIFVNYRAVPLSLSRDPSGTTYTYNTASLTAVYSDSVGYEDISKAYLRASPAPLYGLTNSLQAYYEQSSGTYYLRNAANTAWITGTAGVIGNGYFDLDIDATTVATAGNFMTVTWSVEPIGPAAGKTYGTYITAADSDNLASPWRSTGSWTLYANRAPTRGVLTPSSGGSAINATRIFTTTFNDLDGAEDITTAYFLASPSRCSSTACTYANAFYAYYDEQTNTFRLRNKANTAWLGGFEPGTDNVIDNTIFSLDLNNTAVISANNTLTITWAITPLSPTLNKTYYLYRSVKDASNADTRLPAGYGGTWGRVTAAAALNLTDQDGALALIEQLIAARPREERLL